MNSCDTPAQNLKLIFCGEWDGRLANDPSTSLLRGLQQTACRWTSLPDGQTCHAVSQWIEEQTGERGVSLWPLQFAAASRLTVSNTGKSTAITCRATSLLMKSTRPFRMFLKPAHKYALDAKLMAVPATINPLRRFRLDPDGFGLATLLDDILRIQCRTLNLSYTANEFCLLFPQFKSVQVRSVEEALNRRYGVTRFALQIHCRSG